MFLTHEWNILNAFLQCPLIPAHGPCFIELRLYALDDRSTDSAANKSLKIVYRRVVEIMCELLRKEWRRIFGTVEDGFIQS